MDQTWRTVTNPGSGETFTFLETAQETGGLRVVTLLALDPGGGVSPHSHRQYELFECIDGEVAVHLEGNQRTLSEGETLVANPHTMHGLRNHGDSRATLRATVTPAGDFDRLMRTLADLARDGRMVPGRPPRVNPLVMAYLASRDDFYMPPLPRWLYRPLMTGLAALGRSTAEKTMERYDARPS